MGFWMRDGLLVVDGSGNPIDCATCPCGGTIECDSNPDELMQNYQSVRAILGATSIACRAPTTSRRE